jgi:hypothetical protein
MTGSAVLDTVLGLVFLFYALALVCSGLVEMIANWVKKRAKYLLRGIRDLLDDVVSVDVPEARERAVGANADHCADCLRQRHGREPALRRNAAGLRARPTG